MSKTFKYKATLKLDTGTHTARINQLLITPDGKKLITAGRDKTIRVWDIESRKQNSMLLGQIGPGPNGNILNIALSPDGNYLLALARIQPDESKNSRDADTILRVYEMATGNLQAAHWFPGQLHDLDFSSDGIYIAVTGNPKESTRRNQVQIYRTKDIVKAGFGTLLNPLASEELFQANAVLPSFVRFLPHDGRGTKSLRLVTATWLPDGNKTKGRLTWYSYSSTSKLEKLLEEETEEPKSLTVSRENVIVTPDDKSRKKFYCYNHDGKLTAEVSSETIPARPAFSRDGKHLIVGQRGDSALVQVKVYSVSFGQFQLKSSYYEHDSEVAAVALLDDGTAISAGGDQNAIHIWSTAHFEGEKLSEIGSVGRVIHSIALNGEQINIGKYDDLRFDDGEISMPILFDLQAMMLKSAPMEEKSHFRHEQTIFGNQQLRWAEAEGSPHLELTSPGSSGMDLTLPVDPEDDSSIWHTTTYGFTTNGAILIGSSDGRIRIAPRKPDGSYELPERLLLGHSARVIDHAANDKWLVTAGADQVIRIWEINEVEQNTKTDLYPALNLFIGSDDEWVIWSRSGYYNASPKGDRRFGYHINRGEEKEAFYVPSDRFIKAFFRPDVIQAILETGSEERALEKLSKLGNASSKVDVAEILPPLLELEENGVQILGNEVIFRFKIDKVNPRNPIIRTWIIQNNRFVWVNKGNEDRFEVKLPLDPELNRFKILTETKSTKSMPLMKEIQGQKKPANQQIRTQLVEGPGTARGGSEADAAAKSQINTLISGQEQGILYLLSIGVSKLKNETDDFKSLSFADDDAIGIYNAFGRSKFSAKLDPKGATRNNAFKAVEATILLNEKATKQAIFDAMDEIGDKINKRAKQTNAERDVLMVFLSGHGVRRSDKVIDPKDPVVRELYFWNYDLDKSSTRATGVSFIELGEMITALPVDVILATDACHSGMAGSDVVRGLDPNELAKRMYAINERGMYILNAARSEEFAREFKEMQHGVFTKAILEALEFEQDFNMMNLMASVQRRILYYTKGGQTPVFRLYGDLLPLTVYKK